MVDSSTDPDRFPRQLQIDDNRAGLLRYGENPHQDGAVYVDENVEESNVADAPQLNEAAEELSYVNYLDAAAALRVVKEFDTAAATVIKHAIPAGVAHASSLSDAFERAHATDSMSAFGGIVGLNRECDGKTADKIRESSLKHIIVAPSYSANALQKLKQETHLRIIEVGEIGEPSTQTMDKQILGGRLVQDRDLRQLEQSDLDIVTDQKPSEQQIESLLFSWKVVKHVVSNGTVIATGTETVGIGSGQPSRIDSVHVAIRKGKDHAENKNPVDSVLATDGFAFPDTVHEAAEAGVNVIIQPGGSQRDEEVITAANECGIPMVFTGIRCFRHG